MSADQATKLRHQLIVFTIAILHSVMEQKLTFATGGAISEAVRRWLTERS